MGRKGEDRIKIVCILGNWGSGTTAVTGYLNFLGASTCPPNIFTFDERTPNSYESLAFRNACAQTFEELTLKQINSKTTFRNWLAGWLEERTAEAEAAGITHIVLKHPLSAFLVREINEVCAPTWIMVTRKFQDIERTRLRRQWHSTYGAAGANKIYGTAVSQLIELEQSFLTVAFPDFLADKKTREYLIHYVSLTPTEEQKTIAEGWIR
jgi:hypothetical protein